VTWRLLAITMPLGILAITLLVGWGIGLPWAIALLLAASLAPTDPVLAADVQVGEPTDEEDNEDEVRFALTSEAGLNDGLAFPFTYAAIAIATAGLAPGGWLGEWLAVDVLYKIVVGCAAGAGIGWLLGRLFFRAASDTLRLAEHSEGFVALIMTFLAYGLTELVGGYGFLAVFACAVVVRGSERGSGYHQVLHDFIEQVERLITVGLLLLLGGAIVGGLLGPLTWQGAAVGLALLLVVRPLAGWLALRGSSGSRAERAAIAFFGIRGVGSLYYLAYATTQAEIPGADVLWAVTAFTIVVSVVMHGVTATPVMQWIDRRREHRHAQQATSRAA
ncbi:MAG: cation:proton antiporter, partial [Pseudonocardia sp.]|nr:cation:proton antiporter [Pseudonocardia sp.]